MAKPDLKHNYYQDLDLPTTASVDDVRKAYRKLALQFHPDRNAGREEECVPRFQAIQAANEILSDPTSKAKYDADRRKVGLYPSFGKPSVPTPGNPYAARSDFPPPPRRTQPGTWQRPGGSTQPTGADRFTNFPRPAGATPQKNPAADRTQQFRAWQNMKEPNTAPRPYPPEVPPRQAPPRSPQPPTPGAAPTSTRPRTGRTDTRLPTEEKIRAGMRYGTSAGPSAEEAASHQSAWQAFQQQNAGQPGSGSKGRRRPPPATPKRPGGFDPNAPGSDERAAPQSSHYVNRHKSDDFARDGFPPPPPGPPPASGRHSPTSPNSRRPFVDPLRPFRSRNSNEDAPYAEGNRTSTPYSSYIGEKTAFNAEGLKRSASVRDTTKLSPESAKSASSRARSVDPATRRNQASSGSPASNARGNGFAAGMYDESSSGESSDEEDTTNTPEEIATSAQPSTTSSNTAQHGGPAPRNIKTPKPPSRLFSRKAATSQFSPPSNDKAVHADGEQPSMQERKESANMYDAPSVTSTLTSSSFSRRTWVANQFGTGKAKGGEPSKASVPFWAVPSSVSPLTRQPSTTVSLNANRSTSTDLNAQKPTPLPHSSGPQLSDDEIALEAFRMELKRRLGNVAQLNQLNMAMFRNAIKFLRHGSSTGITEFDTCLRDVLARFPVSATVSPKKLADTAPSINSFSFPIDSDTFKQTPGKTRSVEEINTNFSPNGFHGRFEGSGDYFTDANPRRPSPAQRQSSRRSQRAATTDSTPLTNGSSPVPSATGVSGSNTSLPGASTYFSQEAWQKTFSDGGTFAWPPPPPNPPVSKAPSRSSSRVNRVNGGGPTLGTAQYPHVVDDNETDSSVDETGRPVNGTTPVDDADAMDIDTPPQLNRTSPPEQATPSQPASVKEPRLYSVEPSEWRQQQATQQQTQQHRQTSSSARRAERKSAGESSFKVNLDDLRHTEPFARNTGGLKDLGDLGSSLPFTSKASSALPIQKPHLSKALIKKAPVVPDGPTKLTKISWDAYAQTFANYLVGFHIWNKTYLQHFATCEKEAEDRISNGYGWLQQSGDPINGLGGFNTYLRSIEEEDKSREVWIMGRENHVEGLKSFEKMRERVRSMAESGTLADV